MQSDENVEYNQGPDQLLPADEVYTWEADVGVKLRSGDPGNPITPVSIVTVFQDVAKKCQDNIALIDPNGKTYTYKEYYDTVIQVAKVFIKLGLEKHHGVGIIGFNSPEWVISHLACVFAGGFSTGIYMTNSSESCAYIANNAQCNIIVVEDNIQLTKILSASSQLSGHLKAIVQYKGQVQEARPGLYSWEDILQMDAEEYNDELQKRIRSIAPNKCCTLIYTSGTTGIPKGVMLSHDNIIYTIKCLLQYVSMEKTPDLIVSYLPLSHVAALMIDIYWPMVTGGGTTYFSQPDALKGSLIKSLRDAHPTIFFGVPRVWEKLMEFVIGNNVGGLTGEDKSISLDEQSIRSKVGLERCRFALIGSAPCKREVMEFFKSHGIKIFELYGLSETSGPHTSSNETNFRLGTVGVTVPGFSTKFLHSDEGDEICMYGRHIFMGYLRNELMTREAFDDDHWFRSGDVGQMDEDGFVSITGRIKDLIITTGGENIAPVPIEHRVLEQLPCLGHAVLIGEKRKFLSMLLTFKAEIDPSTEKPKDELGHLALEWCRNLGSKARKISDIINDPLVMSVVQKSIDKVNKAAVSRAQIIQKWTILPKDFSFAGGEIGPTLKMKRNEICKIYSENIDKFYES